MPFLAQAEAVYTGVTGCMARKSGPASKAWRPHTRSEASGLAILVHGGGLVLN